MSKLVLEEAGSSAGLTLDRHLFARLRDVTIDTTPWHRRLWEVGSVLTLREVHEAAQWLETQVLSPAAMRWMCRDMERQAAGDQGIGGPEMRRQLRDTLRADLSAHSRHRRRLAQLIDMIDEGYVSRWTAAVHASQAATAERLARAIAAHLLDRGYSMRHLHHEFRHLASGGATIADVSELAERMATDSPRDF